LEHSIRPLLGIFESILDLLQKIMNPYYEYFESMLGGGGGPSPNIGEIYEGINFQRGFGSSEMWEAQNGSGLSSGLAAIARFALPLLKNGLKYLGNTAVSTAADIAKDAISGENVKKAAKRRFEESAEEVLGKVPGALKRIGSEMDMRLSDSEYGDIHRETAERNGRPRKRNRKNSQFRPRGKAKRLLAAYPVLRRL
jgi:hypothetical protein